MLVFSQRGSFTISVSVSVMFNFMYEYCLIVLVRSKLLVATFWERAARTVKAMFSLYFDYL